MNTLSTDARKPFRRGEVTGNYGEITGNYGLNNESMIASPNLVFLRVKRILSLRLMTSRTLL